MRIPDAVTHDCPARNRSLQEHNALFAAWGFGAQGPGQPLRWRMARLALRMERGLWFLQDERQSLLVRYCPWCGRKLPEG